MACRLAGLRAVGLLSASVGCHSPAEMSAKETASFPVRLISPPGIDPVRRTRGHE